MKYKAEILLYLVSLSFSAALVAAVDSAQSSSPKEARQPFSIAIAPLSSEAKAGSEVYINVRLTNISHQEIGARGVFTAQGGVDTSYQYSCRDATGKSYAKEVIMVGSVNDTSVLRPGESRDQEVPISRACDLSRPGQYEIQLSRSIPGDSKKRVIKSNAIKIIVTE